jgi:hypothetical protein
MSNLVHQTTSQWLAWMDSSQACVRPLLPPHVQLGWECAKSANRLALTRTEKMLCCLMVPSVWYLRNLHNLGGRYKRKLMQAIGI